MKKNLVFRSYDTRAVFENKDTGSCLVAIHSPPPSVSLPPPVSSISSISSTLSGSLSISTSGGGGGGSGSGGLGSQPMVSSFTAPGFGTREFKLYEKYQLPDLGTTVTSSGAPVQEVPIEAIFGIYDLLSGSYVALVTESESYVSIQPQPQQQQAAINIRKVKKVILLPLFQQQRVLSPAKQQDEAKYLELLHQAFAHHSFFFSFTTDITLTQQTLHKSVKMVNQATKPLWFRADSRFFWNRELVVDLIACEADQWIVPFMSAYIEVHYECDIEDEKFTLLFISRRSRHRQGCRYTKRGLDSNGNTANFVETEQILFFNSGKISSFVQIRGSIPLLWSSPVLLKYDPFVYIEDDMSGEADHSKSIELATKHVMELLEKYNDDNHSGGSSSSSANHHYTGSSGISGNNGTSTPYTGTGSVVFINLVDNKKQQAQLGNKFADVVNTVNATLMGPNSAHAPLTYIWFDFHAECKKAGKWNNLSKLLQLVNEKFMSQKYFVKQANGHITSWQTGIIRTNCMDNLDRTNVVQSLLARRSLVIQLGKSLNSSSTGPSSGSPNNLLETPWKPFEKIYKSMWANNANALSFAYAGTGALKVDFTKTGKRTYKGMLQDGWNAVARYYINNFLDGPKQDSIDLLLGNYKPDITAPSPFPSRTSSAPTAASPLVGGQTPQKPLQHPQQPHRRRQETLGDNIIKVFILCSCIFYSLLLMTPHGPYGASIKTSSSAAGGRSVEGRFMMATFITTNNSLSKHLLISLLITCVICCYLLFVIMSKGSTIGERIVIHPRLVKEPIVRLSQQTQQQQQHIKATKKNV
jgi:hypothetical protein